MASGYRSDSQQGCRDTQGCRELVPPIFTIPLYLLNELLPNISNANYGCREPKKVGKHGLPYWTWYSFVSSKRYVGFLSNVEWINSRRLSVEPPNKNPPTMDSILRFRVAITKKSVFVVVCLHKKFKVHRSKGIALFIVCV